MFGKYKIFLRRFVDAQTGATAIEYGLLITILGVGLIAGADGFAIVITELWTGINNTMAGS